jgi:hypothetical protein
LTFNTTWERIRASHFSNERYYLFYRVSRIEDKGLSLTTRLNAKSKAIVGERLCGLAMIAIIPTRYLVVKESQFDTWQCRDMHVDIQYNMGTYKGESLQAFNRWANFFLL